MPGVTNYAANQFLNLALLGEGFSIPSSWYLALFTVVPTASSAGTEVSGSGYSRQSCTWNSPTGTPPTVTGPTSLVQFGAATTAWGPVLGYGLLDASTSGNLWFFNNLTQPRTVNIGDQISYPIGSLTFQVG